MSKNLTVAQISDSHLFADRNGLHHQANVYQNLKKVLWDIKKKSAIDVIVFTGDLTQDHSEASYQLFIEAFAECEISLPVYYLAGNHDEHLLLKRYLSRAPFCHAKSFENSHWQVLLLESKSATPSGLFTKTEADKAADVIDYSKSQLILMHHHPVNVGFFIDDHGLVNKIDFQQFLAKYPSIKAIGCGHVHQALTLSVALPNKSINLYSCPATSIQFDVNSSTAKSNGQPPGYRVFTLIENKPITTQVCFV
ncbi:MAG: metallophosphoesterase [Cognaticolwellia sp.]|jgi:Icc protein